MVWCRDSSINKSWAIFLSKYYFTHPYFQDYPVHGISKKQLTDYLNLNKNNYDRLIHDKKEINLQLPKELLEFTVGDYFNLYKYGGPKCASVSVIAKAPMYRTSVKTTTCWIEWKPQILAAAAEFLPPP